MSEQITHTGIVKKLSNQTIIVGIINQSACASCHAKGACSAADMKDKEVEIHSFEGNYTVGQQVTIIGKTTQGFKALFLGYLLPFILVLTILIIATALGTNESTGGILALSSLVPYYFILYLFRNKLKKSFEFQIKPLQ
ncbi:SoxR reducing system RseC family protein [Mangrovibacterium marinum]|uniref:RseC/MucC-like positive regulator of sigma(E) n=1 Tax=Mangrovibacterium marinum TaxID=1639118 RepID=A0A2T5BY11_9BACT|nr:SoxR reducing system RseC family protein [Mangrovibacterium marinum]PTN06337.1 RseC/MucC-like positive regulator of sigma(E) [Mangrovibacterium marinum]